jgi:hypothetical protein
MIVVPLYLTPIGEWHIEAVEKVPSSFLGEMQKKMTSQNVPQSTISCLGRIK